MATPKRSPPRYLRQCDGVACTSMCPRKQAACLTITTLVWVSEYNCANGWGSANHVANDGDPPVDNAMGGWLTTSRTQSAAAIAAYYHTEQCCWEHA